MEYAVGFDPANPGRIDKSINKIGNYSVPKTHEFIIGLDRELMKNFGVSAAFTYRKMVDFNWDPRIGVRANNYQQVGTFTGSGLPDGSSFCQPYYGVIASQVGAEALANGHERVTRDGYSQRFIGFEASATKRLSNRWMARFAFSSNQHEEFFDGPQSIQDPTPGTSAPLVERRVWWSWPSGGSGKSGIYQLLPLYQFIATGMYQARWGIDLGVQLEHAPGLRPAVVPRSGPPGRHLQQQQNRAGDRHLRPSPADRDDVRRSCGKQFKIQRTSFNLDLDLFNLFNRGTVLGRQYNMRLTGPTGFNQVLEIMNPRIARLGVRFNF